MINGFYLKGVLCAKYVAWWYKFGFLFTLTFLLRELWFHSRSLNALQMGVKISYDATWNYAEMASHSSRYQENCRQRLKTLETLKARIVL